MDIQDIRILKLLVEYGTEMQKAKNMAKENARYFQALGLHTLQI